MRKIAFILSLLILTACNDGPSLFRPSSSGLPYEVLVVCSDELWEAPAGRAIFDVLDTDVPGLPQSERSFRISHTQPLGYTNLLKRFRNVIEVNIDPTLYTQTKMKYSRDKYATPQMILSIQSPSAEELQEYVSKHTQTIVDFFTTFEMNNEIAYLQNHHNMQFLDSARSKFGCDLYILQNITGIKSGKDFLWASDISNNNSSIQNFVMYSFPYTSLDNFSLEYFMHMRDSIMRVNIPGNRPDRYMTTEHDFVDIKDSSFRERYMQVARGLWAMENDMMGGPFVSHSIVDEKNGKVIVAEAFIYAPNSKKGNLMRKLEAALFTLRLPADKDIENSIHIPEIVIEDKENTTIE